MRREAVSRGTKNILGSYGVTLLFTVALIVALPDITWLRASIASIFLTFGAIAANKWWDI
jgi:hypothetical protein